MLTIVTSLLHILLWLALAFCVILIAGVLLFAAAFYIRRGIWEKRLWLERTVEQYKQDWAKEPTNPKWPSKLGYLYTSRMWRTTGEKRREAAKLAFHYYRQWLALEDKERAEGGYSHLHYLAIAALEAGALEDARVYANRLLKHAARDASYTVGNSIYYGNMILGRLAVHSGDIQKAREYLWEAGKLPGRLHWIPMALVCLWRRSYWNRENERQYSHILSYAPASGSTITGSWRSGRERFKAARYQTLAASSTNSSVC